jgi:type II secretory pathway pseudopilin PulG
MIHNIMKNKRTNPGRFSEMRKITNRRNGTGFTLIEAVIASGIATFAILTILYLLAFLRLHNELEQETNRAFQIVTQAMDLERYQLFSWAQSYTVQTIWDNGTPTDPSDDTVGNLEIIVKDPKTGNVLTSPPDPAVLVQIEAILTWTPRGPRLAKKLMRETAMSYIVP